MKHLEPILAGSKSHYVWDLGGKSLAWMYHLKPVISEISGEKTDNPTDNLLITICWKFGPERTSPKPVLSMPTHIQWQRVCILASSAYGNIHKQVPCILPIKTGSLVAWTLRYECDPRRPTSAMPKPFLCRERAFCCSMLPVSQKKRFSSSFLSAISIASFIQFLFLNILRFHDGARYNKNPVNRYGPQKITITLQKHTRQL